MTPIQRLPPSTDRSPTTDRRTVLAGLGLAVASLAGCTARSSSGDAAAVPTPVALNGGKQDDQGGMIVGEHAGPNGQIFYQDHTPNGPDTPAWFHTLAHGLFPYYFEHERLGWEAVAVYVTDYSGVDYDLRQEGDRTFISSHTAASTFGDAHGMTYVAGSGVLGGMGPDLIPFGERADAEAFLGAHGGELVAFDDISEDTVLQLAQDHGH